MKRLPLVTVSVTPDATVRGPTAYPLYPDGNANVDETVVLFKTIPLPANNSCACNAPVDGV